MSNRQSSSSSQVRLNPVIVDCEEEEQDHEGGLEDNERFAARAKLSVEEHLREVNSTGMELAIWARRARPFLLTFGANVLVTLLCLAVFSPKTPPPLSPPLPISSYVQSEPVLESGTQNPRRSDENPPSPMVPFSPSLACGEGGWEPYKDEYCYKIMDPHLPHTYNQAVEMCAGNDHSTLATIRFPAEQRFLEHYLFNRTQVVDNVWLGAKFSATEGTFVWDNDHGSGSAMIYTNWDSSDDPENLVDYCVQMHAGVAALGQWEAKRAKRRISFCARNDNSGQWDRCSVYCSNSNRTQICFRLDFCTLNCLAK